MGNANKSNAITTNSLRSWSKVRLSCGLLDPSSSDDFFLNMTFLRALLRRRSASLREVLARSLALQELAPALLALPLAVLNYDAAARQDDVRAARHRTALVDRVVHVHVMS